MAPSDLKTLLGFKGLSILRRSNTFFEEYWQNVLKQNVIQVPQGCPTINEAMDLAEIFSERKEYTKESPIKIELGEGEHEIVGGDYGRMEVTCNCITFVGKGKDQTTILGGFKVNNKKMLHLKNLL